MFSWWRFNLSSKRLSLSLRSSPRNGCIAKLVKPFLSFRTILDIAAGRLFVVEFA
jgi:hypothetical protein